jgi:hypothetical protein
MEGMPDRKDADIPEDATVEPRILTPDEMAWRAEKRLDLQEREDSQRWPQPKDPLRQPGELSPPPDRR